MTTPEQLLVSWFLAALGVGGTWPNGVALVAEIWSGLSRPMISGIIGMAANVGLFMMSTIATYVAVTPDSWRWMMAAGFATVVLGALILLSVPESPRWLASRQSRGDSGKPLSDAGSRLALKVYVSDSIAGHVCPGPSSCAAAVASHHFGPSVDG